MAVWVPVGGGARGAGGAEAHACKGRLQRRLMEAVLRSQAFRQAAEATASLNQLPHGYGARRRTVGAVVLDDALGLLTLADSGRTLLHEAIAAGSDQWCKQIIQAAPVEKLSAAAKDGVRELID